MKIAIDIDGVVSGGKYSKWDWKDPKTYDRIPVLGKESAISHAIMELREGADAFYCTGRGRDLWAATMSWMWNHGIPQLPTYFCSGQENKPEWLYLLLPDVVVDDNPNVLLGVSDQMCKLILVHDPEFHEWDISELAESGYKYETVKSLAEVPKLLQSS